MQNLSHSAFLHGWLNNAPSKHETEQHHGCMQIVMHIFTAVTTFLFMTVT